MVVQGDGRVLDVYMGNGVCRAGSGIVRRERPEMGDAFEGRFPDVKRRKTGFWV